VEVLAGDSGPQAPGASEEAAADEGQAREVTDDDDLFPTDEDEPATEETAPNDHPEEEDVEPRKKPPDIYQPTAKELEEHRVDHIPYRNWCPWCLRGKANGESHRRKCTHHRISILYMDYFFITREGGVKMRDELPYSRDDQGRAALEQDVSDGKLVKLLMVKDGNTQCYFAHVVPKKGVDADGFAVSRVVNAALWLGHSRVILRGDNEPALTALIGQAMKVLKIELDGVSEEHQQVYDSKANGVVENAIKIFRGQFRTMKTDLEDRIGKRLPNEHPLVSWLAEHVAHQLNV